MRSKLLFPANLRSTIPLIVSLLGVPLGWAVPPVPVAESSPVPTAIAEVEPVAPGLPEITVEGSQYPAQPSVGASGTEIAVAIPIHATAQSKLLAPPVATYVPATASPTASMLPVDSRTQPANFGFVPALKLEKPVAIAERVPAPPAPLPPTINVPPVPMPAAAPAQQQAKPEAAPERKVERPQNRSQTNVARVSPGSPSVRARKLEMPTKAPDHGPALPVSDAPMKVVAEAPAAPEPGPAQPAAAPVAVPELAEWRLPDLTRIFPVNGSARSHPVETANKTPDRDAPELAASDLPMTVVAEAPATPEPAPSPQIEAPVASPKRTTEPPSERGLTNVARSFAASSSSRLRKPETASQAAERAPELLASVPEGKTAAPAPIADPATTGKAEPAVAAPAPRPATATGQSPAIPSRIFPVSGFAWPRTAESPNPAVAVTAPPSAPPEPATETASKGAGLGTRLVSMLQRAPEAPEQVGSQEAKKPEPAANPPVSVEIPPPVKRSASPNSGPVPARTGTPPQGTLVIHFASHSREAQALADREELAQAGVFSRVVPTRGSFGVEYRVVSAPFVTEAEAKRCLTQVKKRSQGFRDATIGELFPDRWQHDR